MSFFFKFLDPNPDHHNNPQSYSSEVKSQHLHQQNL